MSRYKLDDLGWYQFEQLIQSLLKAKIGLGIESWGGHKDLGRDAYFKGSLCFPSNKKEAGIFVFQIKFISESYYKKSKVKNELFSAIRKEIISLEKFKRKNIDYYVLITNANLSGETREKIRTEIEKSLIKTKVSIFGCKDVCDLLDEFPNIRISFPQLLSLRDIKYLLNEIVNKDIIKRSKTALQQAEEISKIFYPTKTYIETWETLRKHHFVVLEGPPEVGKTTIARMIAFVLFSLGWEVYECLIPEQFYKMHSEEKKQIFIADDAFGSTEYDPTRAQLWALDLDKILRKLDKNHFLIWTARTHILAFALEKMHLQGKAELFPKPADIIIDVSKLSKVEKAMILYRHAKFKKLDDIAKKIVKDFSNEIISNEYFTPERVRRFVDYTLPILRNKINNKEILKREQILKYIDEEIKNPTKSMKQSFKSLPIEHKKLLVSMLDIDTYSVKKDLLESSFKRHYEQNSSKSCKEIIDELSDAFLKLRH